MNNARHDAHTARYVAIGDIHGCLDPLQRLIDTLNPQPSDTLVFLGDYVDRGPDSKSVIDYLIELNKSFSCVFLLGNHEVLMLDYLAGLLSITDWERNGGIATLESYTINGSLVIPESHLNFLKSCLLYYDTPDYFFVHGGIKPFRTIEDNLRKMTKLELVWERSHLDEATLNANDYKWEKTVVCGHTPIPRPIVLEKLIAIDTGCVYNQQSRLGRLTAISLPEKNITQIDNRAQQSFMQRLLSRLHQ
jgi:serine/threonine protein phosphatase 1